jgi:hypothetical protein
LHQFTKTVYEIQSLLMLRVQFFSLLCREMMKHFPPAQAMEANIPAGAGIFAAGGDLLTFVLNNERGYYWGSKQRAD